MITRTKFALFALMTFCLAGWVVPMRAADPLATLEYRITGTQLKVSPAALAVPKGIAGSILVEMNDGISISASQDLIEGAHVEAILRGPSFEARRLVSAPNAPMLLPPLDLVGDYQLDQIRLVDSQTGEVRLEGVPATVPVNVFDEVLVSRVTSRPLTHAEIQERGIVIDEENFRAVEFEVGFVLDGNTIPVRFPVVAPRFEQSTEIIPAAELDEMLEEAALINQQIAATTTLPPELEGSQLNIQVQGINFQRAEVNDQDLALQIPPIPALMVIPGNIGYLNQFFSVQIFTENAAPGNSGLSVHNIRAELMLPPGPDRLPATNYSEPGDDPLRMARVGPDAVVQPVQSVVRAGPDERIGTADDIGRLHPGESGQAEFLVEGLQEGLHVMDLTLTADLDGLAAGTVQIKGKAAGSVLVRNPRFSMAFNHPRTVRAGEPYEASVTILNTGITPANLVSVTLSEGSLSGGVLESAATVELGTILPGETATAVYRVRAQRTGAISFSNLTTSEDGLVGRFRLQMGVDADRGVALSPDTFAMPDYVSELPEEVLSAAIRVLGQALSVATAPQLPPGVRSVSRSVVTARVLELAEAGQRLRYGDSLERVLPDILLDWQGARRFDAGFHQILMETGAGREWREALHLAMAAVGPTGAAARLLDRAPDLAARGEEWAVFSLDRENGSIRFGDGVQGRVPPEGGENQGATYRVGGGSTGAWLVARASTNLVLEWEIAEAIADDFELGLLVTRTDGTAEQLRWIMEGVPAGACVRYDRAIGEVILIDYQCDNSPELTITPLRETVTEPAPEILGVVQDVTVNVGRPRIPCDFPEMANFGTVLAVLFSKPMTQASVDSPEAYRLDNGNAAGSVQIQPGARVALLNMRQGVSAIRPRRMTVTGLSDARGNSLGEEPVPVITDLRSGIAVSGRVVRSDGSVASGVPVTLTMYDEVSTLFGCDPFVVRVSQVFTDSEGAFQFDYVMSGIPYSVSATDTAGLSEEALALILDSVSGDRVARERLMELAGSASARSTLLEQFSVGALPEAIAKVEGLDRALLRDEIVPGSSREGTTVPVALRFRGRATVSGQVVTSDGITPASGAAVNLFPDPDSRELGRGIFADSQGRFAFTGVPLGVFSVKAETSTRQFRTVSGLVDQPGQVTNIVLVLNDPSTAVTELRGRVLEADQSTPHPHARVFVGRLNGDRLENIVAVETADGMGAWSAPGLPVRTYDVVAVSLDGKRRGDRREIPTAVDGLVQLTVSLQDVTTVFGRVETSTGQAVPNAVVAGGESLVRTDENGLFTLPGVPTGRRTISAGLERDPEAGIDFPRLGSVSANIVAGVDNFVVVRLRPAGRIVGRVLDAGGVPVPNVRVVIPQENGFYYVDANEQGEYKFENLGLGNYTLSAPGPSVFENDTSGLIGQIREGNEEEVLAAIGEAFEIFTGASDPFLTGENDSFNPLTWGFTKTRLDFDGQTRVVDIEFLREGTVSGVVMNSQGVPIGARVRLTGIGPLANGQPSMVIRGERNSDPATGVFVFENQLLAGVWGLQAASPFYPVVITENGATSFENPNATGIILQFPDVAEVNGRLTGYVLQPDGTPAGSNVNVQISFGDDYVIRTDDDGFFDTQIKLPSGYYHVEAEDPSTGLVGDASVQVKPGITNSVTVTLLGRADVLVQVELADGTPVSGARVRLEQGSYPQNDYEGLSATDGTVSFKNIFEGQYAVTADLVSGPTRISGRSGVTLRRGAVNVVTVSLQPTGSILGRFVKRDRVTPISFAQVAVGTIGFAATDEQGAFAVEGIPLGTYGLRGSDPVTGAGASLQVTISADGETRQVLLVEGARGDVKGYVIDSYGNQFVSGAEVTLRPDDGIESKRTVTTGPDGQFHFAGVPAGGFRLEARDLVTGTRGIRSGSLPEDAPEVSINIPLEPMAFIRAQVIRPDGITPATNAVVKVLALGGQELRETDTDAEGVVVFADIPLGRYRLRAEGLLPFETRSVTQEEVVLETAGSTNEVSLTLQGVGRVSGTVFLSDGVTPVAGAEVIVENLAPFVRGEREIALTDANGVYQTENIATGLFRVSATFQALGASYNGEIQNDGQALEANLTLGGSGTVSGRLVRADGLTPGGGIDVLLTFASQSGLPGRANARTGSDGSFVVSNLPVGSVNLEAIATDFNGIARLETVISENGEVVNLGDIILDEHDPVVVQVSPAHTSIEVPISTVVELLFSEALDPTTISPGGIYLRGPEGQVSAAVELLEDSNSIPRIVRITPEQPLLSEVTYEVIVIDDERRNATGGLIAEGPRDVVGRPLVLPFVSRFTTADNDPPALLSFSPAAGEVQVDPRAVVRLAFDEPIRAGEFSFRLVGPTGEVPGTAQVGVNGLVLTFIPAAALEVNASYTAEVDGVQDLAGNFALDLPFSATFQTLDTLGPEIERLEIVSGQSPVAATSVPVEAVLATTETNVTFRFTQNLQPVATVTNEPFRANIVLPSSGSTTVRAIATDRHNNDGPIAELTIQVVSNQPPTIQFVRITPSSGAVPSGGFVAVDVIASDDSAVANLRAIASGALKSDLFGTNNTRLRIQGTVPTTASPDQKIEIFAEATDETGTTSGEQTFVLEVSDATIPTLVLLSPAPGATVPPGPAFELAVLATDNSSELTFDLQLQGGLVGTQSVQRVVQPNVPITNIFSIPLENAAFDGEAFSVRVLATDTAGNRATLTNTFRLPDGEAPTLVTVYPSNQATDIELLPTIRVGFSEAVTNIDETTFQVLLGGDVIPGTHAYESSNSVVSWIPGAPLVPGGTYELRVTSEVTDLSLNPIVAIEQEFAVTPFAITQPTNAVAVVEGQRLPVAAAGNNTTGVRGVTFHVDGLNHTFAASPFETNVVVPALDELPGTGGFLFGEVVVTSPHANLLRNPGNDEPLDGSEIPDWEEVVGSSWTQRLSDPPPHEGEAYFFAGAGAQAELRQDVDVTAYAAAIDAGGQVFEFSGYVRSWGDGDRSRIVVEYWDEALVGLLGSWDSGDHSRNDWTRLQDVRLAPAGTRVIRVRLISSRNSGSNNDGYYDSLRLLPLFTVPLVPVALEVHPANEDADGDGVANGVEIAIGSNPFVQDSGSDSDGDGLANLDEIQRGTDPGNPDSDGAFLNDGDEVATETDPLDPDTDKDGVLDGLDTNPLQPGGPPTVAVAPLLETVEGVATNLPVRVGDGDGNLVRLLVQADVGPEGLRAEFHALGTGLSQLASVDFSATPTHVETVPRVEFPAEPFWSGGPGDYFAVRLSGRIQIPQEGSYTFYTGSDDGSQLLIDGILVANNDGLHGYNEVSGQITLTAGAHDFEVRYFENTGGAALRAFWQGPGFGKQLIPDAAFFSPYFHWDNGRTETFSQVIGGWNEARATEMFLEGERFGALREGIQGQFPLAHIHTTEILTAKYLQMADVLVLSSIATDVQPIRALESWEQALLMNYVLEGGDVVILADNHDFGTANQSLLAPFGMSAEGQLAGEQPVNVIDHPITRSAVAAFTNYATDTPGWFSSVPTNAVVLGRLAANDQPALVLLPAGSLGAGSGSVLLASDLGLPPGMILNFLTTLGMSNQVAEWNAELVIEPLPPGTNIIQVIAYDLDTLSATGQVVVVTLPDDDGDGVPNRDDNDQDGDGLPDDEELLAGTDPNNPDTDGDSVPDGQDLRPLVNNRPPVAGVPSRNFGLMFDGVDDYVQIPDRSFIEPAAGTIEFTFAATETTNIHHLFYVGAGGDGFGGQDEMHIHLHNNYLEWINFGGGEERWRLRSVEEIEAGRFYHVAAVWTAASGDLLLYLDGKLVDSEEYVPFSVVSWNNQVRFGRHIGGESPDRAYRGILDEVRIWNEPRTHVEIRRGMLRRLAGNESGLVGYWPLDETRGDSIFNQVAHRAHGTLAGGEVPAQWVQVTQGSIQQLPATAEQDAATVLELPGRDEDGDALEAVITQLPVNGRLFQTADGTSASVEITTTPVTVTHPDRLVVYLPNPDFAGPDTFGYYVTDAQENSATAQLRVHVRPPRQPLVAAEDERFGFEETPLVLADLLANDTHPGDASIVIAGFTAPENGSVTRNPDGSLTYTPNPGFSGTDTFNYTVADEFRWHRVSSFTPGMSHGTALGNPNDDDFGFVSWRYEWSRGGALESEQPWYLTPGALMTWDANWYGGSGVWSRGNDLSPPIAGSLTHNAATAEVWEHVPRVAWISPFDNFDIDIVGQLAVVWSGNEGIGSSVEVDVVIAHHSEAGMVSLLYTNSISKPNPEPSAGDRVDLPVDLRGVRVDAGDHIVVTHRARNVVSGRWINLQDDLTIVPSSLSNSATVTVHISANDTPVATAPQPASALRFDGSDDYLDLGSPASLQVTGNQTIEFWIKPTSFADRQNPIAKSYAGEGTMTVEVNGQVNYYYGVIGSNAGSGGIDYQGFNSVRSLPVGEWTHLALVRDLDTMKLRWYMNGEMVNEADALFPAAVAGGNPFYIGRGYVRNFAGELDEVRIWNVARNASEIASGAFGRMTGAEEGLVGYWNFDEGAGTMVNDISTGGNAITMPASSAQQPVWVGSFTPFEDAVATYEDTDLILTLTGTDGDGESLTTWVTKFPGKGILYQRGSGSTPGDRLVQNNALFFDGVDDYVLLGSDQHFEITNSLTVSAWIHPLQMAGNIIVNKEGEYEIGFRRMVQFGGLWRTRTPGGLPSAPRTGFRLASGVMWRWCMMGPTELPTSTGRRSIAEEQPGLFRTGMEPRTNCASVPDRSDPCPSLGLLMK